jgi:archaetidylinositol phosphate synthase
MAPRYDRRVLVARKNRKGYELLCEALFRPLAQLVVLVLAPLRVPPPAVVLANAACALAGAVVLARGQLVVAALLFQAKTVLDNADGQLARTTGRISAFGRYLDSECDLLTNAAIFAALGFLTGRPLLAAVAFVVLTLVLSVNFNLERLARGGTAMPAAGGVLARVYGAVYAPQDRFVERVATKTAGPRTLTLLANMGLTTQLAVLGACLLAGRPTLYFLIVLVEGAVVLPLVLRLRAAPAAATEAL